MKNIFTLDDFEKAAKKHLPRMIFSYIEGATETNSAHQNALQAYKDYAFLPRYLRDVSKRFQEVELWGETWASPFGIPPIGGAAMMGYRADLQMARAAYKANIPFILSAASLIALEDVIAQNPKAWMQVYLPGDEIRIGNHLSRIAKAGFKTLVVTADTPLLGNRENNARNGFSMPMRVTTNVALQSITHPAWLFGTVGRTLMQHGMPHFENMDAFRGPSMISQNVTRNTNNRDELTWGHLRQMRKEWQGKLIVKGLTHTQDIIDAKNIGVDAVIVSTHGGRQLDYALSPLKALISAKQAAGNMPLFIDGGIRRGSDIFKALILGAQFCFIGRPMIYAASVGEQAGVSHAIQLMQSEIHRNMALMGVNHLSELNESFLIKN